MRIDDALKESVIFLGIMAGDNFVPFGTGFLMAYRVDSEGGRSLVYLVTARHVVEEMRASNQPNCLRVNNRQGGVTIARLGDEWISHPTEKACDVAVTGVSIPPDQFDYRVLDFLTGTLTQEYIDENDIGAGDEVFTSGLLTVHFGEERNLPVVRVGNIATMPVEPVDLGPALGKQKVYLIESRSIGGLSGSPVFLQTPPIRMVRNKTKDMGGHRTGYLLGVNIGLFEVSPHNDSIPVELADRRESFLETMSAGIAIVVPIQRVVEIINGPTLKPIREKLAAGN
jgi:hypothetical protein